METKEKKIGEVTYVVTPLPGRKGAKTFMKLVKMAGPVFDEGNASIAQLLDQLDIDQVFEFAEMFADRTIVRDSEGAELHLKTHFDSHFAANYSAMGEWLLFCLEVNYSSFLGTIEFDGSKFLAALMGEETKEKQ